VGFKRKKRGTQGKENGDKLLDGRDAREEGVNLTTGSHEWGGRKERRPYQIPMGREERGNKIGRERSQRVWGNGNAEGHLQVMRGRLK